MSTSLARRLLTAGLDILRVNLKFGYRISKTRAVCVYRHHLCSPIKEVFVDNHSESVKVSLKDNSEFSFPWLFLQDNCTCKECFHVSSKSRKRLMTNLDLNKKIKIVELHNNEIKCIWSDGHEGVFSEKWLIGRRFTVDNERQRKAVPRDDPELIDASYQLERFKFDDVLCQPEKLLKLLQTLSKNGVFLLEGAPKQIGQLRILADKIGFIRTTHYGNEFTVKSEMNASNLAYTSAPLCVHTDLPYYVYPPGVQLLHCIKQFQADDGGHTNLVDGFLIANQMKKYHPEQYCALSEISVEFRDIGEDFIKFNKVHHSPTFVHCRRSGNLTRILYSNQQLSSFLPIPFQKVRTFYKSLKLFTDMCYEQSNLMRFKMKEGDILIFDNWRMLHGRERFDPLKGDRHLEGCYIDWDEVSSTIRVLRSECKNAS